MKPRMSLAIALAAAALVGTTLAQQAVISQASKFDQAWPEPSYGRVRKSKGERKRTRWRLK